MWSKTSLLLPVLLFRAAQVGAQAPQTVYEGPNGPCPAATTVLVQPGLYSQVFQSASSIINLFGNGDTIVISSAPTTYITQTYITTTVISTVTTAVPTSASGASTPPNTNTNNAVLTSTSAISTTPASSAAPKSLTGPTTFPPVESHITYPPVAPPQTTAGPPPVLTVTITGADGSVTTTTEQQPSLTIGEGLNSGTVTSISPTDPVILGVSFDVAGGNMVARVTDKVRRQDSAATTSAVPVSGFAQGSSGGSAGGAGNDCGFAQRYALTNGMLMSGNDSVGRNYTDFFALLQPVPFYDDVNQTFTFNNGILQWDSVDQGRATFYQCGGGPLYAGFPDPPYSNCSVATIGGIIASACPVDYTANDTTTSSSSAPSATPVSSSDTAIPPMAMTTTTTQPSIVSPSTSMAPSSTMSIGVPILASSSSTAATPVLASSTTGVVIPITTGQSLSRFAFCLRSLLI